MYLYFYRKRPNFGDALNNYLWAKWIEVSFESEIGSDEVFVGIGTILNERLPSARVLHIFGSGLGYGTVTQQAMKNWRIHFVRGPLTARALGLDLALSISDPAILLHRTENLNRRKDVSCAFMPHHSIRSQCIQRLCEEAGVHYIDPVAPYEFVIDEILRSERLICSAMHGAIAAEALRVPWLPVVTHFKILRSKWDDWAASMEAVMNFKELPTIWPEPSTSLKGRIVASSKAWAFRRSLANLARSKKFQLGSERILNNRLQRIEDCMATFNAEQGRQKSV